MKILITDNPHLVAVEFNGDAQCLIVIYCFDRDDMMLQNSETSLCTIQPVTKYFRILQSRFHVRSNVHIRRTFKLFAQSEFR